MASDNVCDVSSLVSEEIMQLTQVMESKVVLEVEDIQKKRIEVLKVAQEIREVANKGVHEVMEQPLGLEDRIEFSAVNYAKLWMESFGVPCVTELNCGMVARLADVNLISLAVGADLYNGCLDLDVAEKAKRVARRKKNEPTTKTHVSQIQTNDERDVTALAIAHILKTIKGIYEIQKKPLCYFSLVLDPDSFSHSVENIYHVSFLCEEGVLNWWVEGDSTLPKIEPIRQGMTKREVNKESSLGKRNAWIVSLDMPGWKHLCEYLHIEKAAISRTYLK